VYRISVFGFLGPNRRLPALLRVLSNFAQRDRFRLDIYGTIEGEEKIHQLVARLGLNDLVTLHGFVPEDQLDAALRVTDLVVNMRYPSMGEASASQLHLWQYALPALVTRTAWYETLPENTVAFVRPEQEAEDIRTHLAAFLADPEKYRELGRNGQRHVTENHSIEVYANSLLEVAARVSEFQARWIARDLAHRAGAAMNAWCDSSTIDAFLPRVVEQIGMLVAGNPLAATAGVAATSTGLPKSG
jgi:glycosyltransferase involved in cell wall biosynthesis